MSDKIISISEPELDFQEKLYVSSYLSTLNHNSAYLSLHPSAKGKYYSNKYEKRANIQFHIAKQVQVILESRNLNKESLLLLLYKEATDHSPSSSHGARVTAVTTLGKHLGLFSEKKEESKSITYNIINYNENEEPPKELPDLPVDVEEIDNTNKDKDVEIDLVDYKEQDGKD